MRAAELDHLREAAERSLLDTCRIAARVLTANNLNEQVPSWPAWGPEIACGYAPSGGRRVQRADGTLLVSDAGLRLPLGTAIAAGDRVRITRRAGEVLATPPEYQVLTVPRPGLTTLLADLQDVS